jgi:hypothetical protein
MKPVRRVLAVLALLCVAAPASAASVNEKVTVVGAGDSPIAMTSRPGRPRSQRNA